MTSIVDITLPIRTINAKNTREHWSKLAKRTAEERGVTAQAVRARLQQWPASVMVIPVRVTLTRLSPGELDSIDNLSLALSAIRDGVADAFGRNDRDPRLTFEYAQEKTKRFTPGRQAPNRYGVRILIESVRDYP